MKKYYDTTTIKKMTLTPASQEIIKGLDGALTITTYVNLMDYSYSDYALPRLVMMDMQRFEQYIRFKPETKLRYVYYYCDIPGQEISEKHLSLKERARKVAEAKGLDFSLFLSPEELREEVDLSSENYTFVRLLERENGNKTFLRVYNDLMKLPGEAEISAALKKLVGNSPKIAFLTGHGERDIERQMKRDYSFFTDNKNLREALINQGFDVMTLDLSVNERIPADICVLVIADMSSSLSPGEFQKIEHYVRTGGNVVLACEPGQQEIMNPLAELLGVSFKPGYIVARNREYLPNFIMGNITAEAQKLMPRLASMAARGGIVSVPGAVGLYYWGENLSTFISPIVAGEQNQYIPLLTSPASGSWNKLEKMNLLEDSLIINSRIGEQEKSNTLALAVSKKVGDKEQRAIVLGDADMWSNGELNTRRLGVSATNFSFITECFRWLVYEKAPVDVSRPLPVDNRIFFEFESLGWLNILFLGLFPVTLIAIGLRIWWLRVRR